MQFSFACLHVELLPTMDVINAAVASCTHNVRQYQYYTLVRAKMSHTRLAYERKVWINSIEKQVTDKSDAVNVHNKYT